MSNGEVGFERTSVTEKAKFFSHYFRGFAFKIIERSLLADGELNLIFLNIDKLLLYRNIYIKKCIVT